MRLTTVLFAACLLSVSSQAADLFGLPTAKDPATPFKEVAAFLPKGVEKARIGMKLDELKKLRKADSLDKDPLQTPFSLVELNRAEGIALDRTAFQYDEETGLVTGLWLRNETATAKREHFFTTTKVLFQIFGKPKTIYENKERNEIGFLWDFEEEERTLLLQFKYDPATWPSLDLHINHLSADFRKKIEAAAVPYPKDFRGFLNGYLDKSFPN